MSLDKLAVIFLIIIIPISVVLTKYTDTQTETLKKQLEYDQKLESSTVDAIKAYQLNAFNEDTSNNEQIQMRNISASANAFFTSLSRNLEYNKQELQDYVPALVFTMYDGYYMYSKFTNTLADGDYATPEKANQINSDNRAAGINSQEVKPSTYQNGELLYGICPFVSYSCRYKDEPKAGDDFVISYTLDNYITIQGIVNGMQVNESGYLISGIQEIDSNTLEYNGIEITSEPILTEYIGSNTIGSKEYKYHKINGVKWYYDDTKGQWFQIINGKQIYDISKNLDTDNDNSAFYYYKEAKEFTEKVLGNGTNQFNLSGLKVKNATDGNNSGGSDKFLKGSNEDEKIFDANNIEEPASNFNQHRLAVIRYTIEKNLSIAIKNYNHFKYNGHEVYTDFQMPELKETEWDKIMNNITLISFLQGMPIGSKLYSGCAVVSNNKNDEVVSESSIYIANKFTNQYYMPTYRINNSEVNDFSNSNDVQGVLNLDLERRALEPLQGDNTVGTNYYYPKLYYANYNSITNPIRNANINSETTDDNLNYAYNGNIYKYMSEKANPNIAKAYFTALGRERYSKYLLSNTVNVTNRINNYQGTIVAVLDGDINGDEMTDEKDLKMLQQYLNGWIDLDDKQKAEADLNQDGKINMKDVVALQRLIEENKVTIGDINNDEEINDIDVELLQQYLNKVIGFDNYQKKAADVNEDGKVNMKDLVALQRLIEENKVIIGDVNRDKEIDDNDVTLLQKYLVGEASLDDKQQEAADVNEDGKINMKDLVALQRLIYVNNAITGDTDEDGDVDENDLTVLRQYLNHWLDFNEYQMKAADIYEDGKVNMKDLVALQRLLND